MAQKGDDTKPTKPVPIVIEGFEINEQNVTFQRLQEFSLNLFEKLLRQREERNFMLLERDKLRTLLENTHHDLKVARATALNKETDLEEAKAKYNQQIKEVNQEVKYVLYDHNLKLSELQNEENNMLLNADKEFASEELELLNEKHKLKETIREQEIKFEEEMKYKSKQNMDEINEVKNMCSKKQTEIEINFRRHLSDILEQMKLKHEMEMVEVEERKNTHLAELRQIHKVRIEELKNYFNTTTRENLAVISSLKQSIDGMKKTETDMAVQVKALKRNNACLREPLKRAKQEIKELTRQLVNYEKDLLCLQNTQRFLSITTENIENLQKENMVALNTLKELTEGHNSEHRVTDLPTDFKTISKQRKKKFEQLIKYLLEDLHNKNSIIDELISSDSEMKKLASQISKKEFCPMELKYELAVICKAHDDILQTYEEKMWQFGIPKDDLEYEPLLIENIGKGPAGLVTKNV